MASLGDAKRLGRDVLRDVSTRRLFTALMVFDVLFVLMIVAKAFDLVSFKAGIGNLMIASQFALAALVFIFGWWRYRDSAFGSLCVIASLLAAVKILKFHKALGVLFIYGWVAGIDDPTRSEIGVLVFSLVFGAISIVILALGWRGTDRAGRAAIVLTGLVFGIVASASIGADALSYLLMRLVDMDHDTLSRLEQGIELVTVSALLALAVGVVRVGSSALWMRNAA